MGKVSTCLWYEKDGEAAARFYTSLIPNSRIDGVMQSKADSPSGKKGETLVVDFTLDGQKYQALNGGPYYKLSPAASISVLTDDQAETDRLWEALLEGGSPQQCGWLTDRWGLSWQIVPRVLLHLLHDPNPRKSQAVMQAMLRMGKLDIADLQRAHALA